MRERLFRITTVHVPYVEVIFLLQLNVYKLCFLQIILQYVGTYPVPTLRLEFSWIGAYVMNLVRQETRQNLTFNFFFLIDQVLLKSCKRLGSCRTPL